MKENKFGLFVIGREEPVLISTQNSRVDLKKVASKAGKEFFVAKLIDDPKAIRGREKK